jgi:hypothetical protein
MAAAAAATTKAATAMASRPEGDDRGGRLAEGSWQLAAGSCPPPTKLRTKEELFIMKTHDVRSD